MPKKRVHGGYADKQGKAYKKQLDEAGDYKKPTPPPQRRNPVDRQAETERNRWIPKSVRDIFGD